MKIEEQQITRLVTKNNQRIAVTTNPKDGKIYVLDNDNQMTKDILPDGVYSSEGLSDLQVKDGKFVKSKLSIKKGMPPRAAKIPFVSINQKMQLGQEAKKKSNQINL